VKRSASICAAGIAGWIWPAQRAGFKAGPIQGLSARPDHKAANAGIKTRFITAADMILQVETAQRQSRLPKYIKTLSGYTLLIIDEIGYLPMHREQAHLFFQIVAARYEKGSTTTLVDCCAFHCRAVHDL
jgi:hypothetical protein